MLSRLAFASVLDLCCGTGNQLLEFASRPGVKHIAGVDLSAEALGAAKSRLSKIRSSAEIILECAAIDEAFERLTVTGRQYDLVSCFYGLYYAKDFARTIRRCIAALADGGALLIVGPYGRNNASLFRILERHYELPWLVKHSSTTFMQDEVLPVLRERCAVETATFRNRIRYPDPESLLRYWRSTTFYEPAAEAAVARDLRSHFRVKRDFVVEKHVLAFIARRVP